jgi:Peptidase inhibitor I78 family
VRLLVCTLAAAIALPGTAAAQSANPAGVSAACRVAAAHFVLGESYSDTLARRARRRAGAREVRKIEPGRVYTMDFKPDRLNLDVDRGGHIRAVRCG